MPKLFHLFLIKPSHYDNDGYVIQWVRSAIPANTLAAMNGLALDCAASELYKDGKQLRPGSPTVASSSEVEAAPTLTLPLTTSKHPPGDGKYRIDWASLLKRVWPIDVWRNPPRRM